MQDLLAGVIGLVLLIAGADKLVAGRDAFSRIVRGYQLVGPRAADAIARILPFVEIGVGAGLLALTGVPVLAWAAAGLFAAFTIAIAVNLTRNRSDIPCGCFGQSDEKIGAAALARSLALFVAAVTAQLADFPLDLDVSRAAYLGLVWAAAATVVMFFAVVGAVARMTRLGRDLTPIVDAMDREDSFFGSGGDR